MKVILATLASVVSAHYGNPYLGPCASDEQSISITGITGEFCSPACSTAGACPTDVPTGTTAKPTCDLNSPQGAKYCSLVCGGAGAAGCPTGGSCKAIQGTGICTYDQAGPTPPGPTPPGPTPPTPTPPSPGPSPTPPTPPGGPSWYILPYRESIIIGVGTRDAEVAYFAAGSNGGGAGVLATKDGGKSFTTVPINSTTPSMLLLSAAAASDKDAIVTGIFAEHYTTDGEMFHTSLGPGIIAGPSQCSKPFRDTEGKFLPKYGIAGTFGADNGVATSTDAGLSFADAKTIPISPDVSPARYASFPTEKTWYVSLGSFPESPSMPTSRAPALAGLYEDSIMHRLSNVRCPPAPICASPRALAPRPRPAPSPRADGRAPLPSRALSRSLCPPPAPLPPAADG